MHLRVYSQHDKHRARLLHVALHVSDRCICQATVEGLLRGNMYKACAHLSCLATYHAVSISLRSAEREIWLLKGLWVGGSLAANLLLDPRGDSRCLSGQPCFCC